MSDWIISFLGHTGYGGVVVLMALENVFPPIPSELIMPFPGYAAARGDLNLWGALAAGTAGSLLGNLPWYVMARAMGVQRFQSLVRRYGRWLTVSGGDVRKACRWFEAYGYAAVVMGRLVPGIRTLISVPAGFVALPFLPFLVFSVIGSFIWNALLSFAGYYLADHYARASQVVGVFSNVVVGVLLAVYIYRFITFKKPA